MKKKMALLPLAVLAGAWLLLPQHGWCAKQPSPPQYSVPADPADAILPAGDAGTNPEQQDLSKVNLQQPSQSEQIFYQRGDVQHFPWDDLFQSTQSQTQTQQQGDPEP